ncbi:MAG: hypothetical protein DRJ96_07080 [Thermoprotei archaeon]|nr:MAG: hypothetical protein DRJ67_07200 [Thermoprotei archaeon]RLE96269.1 MAG: hypothetical protein DRJ96_07080 [Thermoprotei archaeon]
MRSVESRRVLAGIAAASLMLAAVLICSVEERIKPVWSIRSPVAPSHLWADRWADILAQALVLLATAAAVAHTLRRVGGA